VLFEIGRKNIWHLVKGKKRGTKRYLTLSALSIQNRTVFIQNGALFTEYRAV